MVLVLVKYSLIAPQVRLCLTDCDKYHMLLTQFSAYLGCFKAFTLNLILDYLYFFIFWPNI